MSHPLEGVIRTLVITAISVGAGATNVNVRPDQGKLWEVLLATGRQNDGAVWNAWRWVGEGSDEEICEVGAGGANQYLILGTFTSNASTTAFSAPMIVTYDRYLRYQFAASAAAKTGTVHIVVKEFRGVAVEA